jgi:hypothetical protein
MSPETRLIHTMRQVIKTVHIFSDLYPYRSDDLITNKLCHRFYKQFKMSIENFNDCLIHLTKTNTETYESSSNRTVDTLNQLIIECDDFFTETNLIEPEINSKSTLASNKNVASKLSNKILKSKKTIKVIRQKNSNLNEYIKRVTSPHNIR